MASPRAGSSGRQPRHSATLWRNGVPGSRCARAWHCWSRSASPPSSRSCRFCRWAWLSGRLREATGRFCGGHSARDRRRDGRARPIRRAGLAAGFHRGRSRCEGDHARGDRQRGPVDCCEHVFAGARRGDRSGEGRGRRKTRCASRKRTRSPRRPCASATSTAGSPPWSLCRWARPIRCERRRG